MLGAMGNALGVCLGSSDAKRAAHDNGTDRLLSKFRRDQENTQHKINVEEERLLQLTNEAKRLKVESEKLGNRNDPQRRLLERQAKDKLAQRKQVQEQLQRLQTSATEESKMILRLESLRDSGPQANLYKEAKRQIEGYEKFMAVDDLAEIRDQVDEAWRNAENMREVPRRVDRDSLEIDNEFKSLSVDATFTVDDEDTQKRRNSQFDDAWLDKELQNDVELNNMRNEHPRRVVHA